jgi:periplasmic divalent cation tolerance protein
VKIILFYVPFGSEDEAKTVGKSTIEQQLAACTNIFPIQSMYPWEGALQNDHEFVLLLKTIPEKVIQLTAFIQEKHSYEIPCILHWEVEVNDEYAEWMRTVLTLQILRP